jgi:hypothetical protein
MQKYPVEHILNVAAPKSVFLANILTLLEANPENPAEVQFLPASVAWRIPSCPTPLTPLPDRIGLSKARFPSVFNLRTTTAQRPIRQHRHAPHCILCIKVPAK